MRSIKQLLEGRGAPMSVQPGDTVFQALEAMAAKDIGALLVIENGRLVGIFSERDYARKVILRGRSSAETAVWEIMSSPVTTVAPGDSVSTCMMLMTERKIRHLPVVEAGKVVGVLSIGDLVKSVIEEQQQEIAQLQRYIVS